ncbi:MAG: hypothetical protein IJJ28_03445, partial [Lentisphaeria bacterium]|nr:hypothetical protein [Lentisphaeria bacterium]
GKSFVAALLLAVAALAVHADTNWMVLPRYSKSGRTMLHGCRNSPKKLSPMLRWEQPGKDGKYHYLSIGQKDGFRFGGINECGVATIFTGGGPMLDKNPPKSPENFSGRRAITEILRNCATAKEAEALLRSAADRKLIEGALIIFIVDRNHAWVVECSPRNFVSWELPHAFCVYANLWKLPGMDDSSTSPVERTLNCCQREWAVRETLRRQLDANKCSSFPDSFAASRLNISDLNSDTYAAARSKSGKRKFTTAPHNRSSHDSYLMEVDPEFGELSCIFVAYGPARHTVYLPVPLGAAEAMPEELFSDEWIDSAFARMKAAKPEDPVNPEITKFEAKLLAEFHKRREEARWKLRHDKPAEACRILRECLKKQAAETFAFLKGLK